MEALRQIACTSSDGIATRHSVGFVNDGLVKMKKKKEKVGIKNKLKLLKGLSKDLANFSEMGLAVDQDQNLLAQVRGKMISEAAEVLMKQLERLKEEEKELKRKRKEEMNMLKGKQSSSACESDSSDSECEGEIIQVKGLIKEPDPVLTEESLQSDGITKRVEVCMGNKCKKSGSGALLEEFQRVMGAEGDVVGCKCMGKCRDGPNVKLSDPVATPLFIGVGLEDVTAIVGNLFAQGSSEDLKLGLNPV